MHHRDLHISIYLAADILIQNLIGTLSLLN